MESDPGFSVPILARKWAATIAPTEMIRPTEQEKSKA